VDPTPAPERRERSRWRSVAMPSEHGGWGLTGEPALLGLLVKPSWAGAALGIAALLAFLARTPLKLVLVDRHRDRWLERTGVAARVAGVELTLLVALAVAAGMAAGWKWLVPVAIAGPLIGVELWFDMRSRSRRLLPELCGSVGIAGTVAAIALAGGASASLAGALWLVIAARAIASVPFARTQVLRLRHGDAPQRPSDLAQLAGVAVAAGAVALDAAVAAGAVAIVVLAVAELVWARRPPVPAKALGLRQLFLGLGVVAVTAAGVLAA
jgi:YwiC-like protein